MDSGEKKKITAKVEDGNKSEEKEEEAGKGRERKAREGRKEGEKQNICLSSLLCVASFVLHEVVWDVN